MSARTRKPVLPAIGTRIGVWEPVRSHLSSAVGHSDAQLLPGMFATVFAHAPVVRYTPDGTGHADGCRKRHEDFAAVEFVQQDGTKDRAGVLPCNVAPICQRGHMYCNLAEGSNEAHGKVYPALERCELCIGRGYRSEKRRATNKPARGFYARTCRRCGGGGYVNKGTRNPENRRKDGVS